MSSNEGINSSEHGSSSSSSSSSGTIASLLPESSATSAATSGTTSPSESTTSNSASFPGNVAETLQQIQQGSSSQNAALAQNNVEKALAEELKRSQFLKSQLAAMDKVAMAQATVDQQQAALFASSGVTYPSALQQAAAVNAMLLNSSLATQALTSLQLGALASGASASLATLPLQASNLVTLAPPQQQLNNAALYNPAVSMLAIAQPPGLFNTNIASQQLRVVDPSAKMSYRDASLIPDPIISKGGTTKGEPFPTKLHRMLSELEKEGKDDIAAFSPHGRAFVVHKPKQFAQEIMPKYFRMSRFSSFQRQLNLCTYILL